MVKRKGKRIRKMKKRKKEEKKKEILNCYSLIRWWQFIRQCCRYRI